MNETQFLRNQLAVETKHLESVLTACTDAISNTGVDSASTEFLHKCLDYLSPSVKAFADRDRARLALHYARSTPSDQDGQSESAKLEGAIAHAQALWTKADTARDDIKILNSAVQALNQWLAQRNDADCLSDRSYTVEQWRNVAFVSAKSIIEERARYTRVEAALPIGVRGMGRHGH